MGTLYVVATPLGNLEDLTFRALRVLKEVDLIAAEDTRRVQVLLRHYGVTTPTLSYHKFNAAARRARLLEALAQGDVALVSDAGTPLLSDPGAELVRAAWEAGHRVVPIPGPSAPAAALSAAGLPADRYLFLGYLPRRGTDRRALLGRVAPLPWTLVLFEVPHRLRAALEDLVQVLGPQRPVACCRELTKLHEEIWRGTLGELLERYRTEAPRGEYTLVIAGAPEEGAGDPWEEAARLWRTLAAEGLPPSRIAREVARTLGLPRGEVYRRGLEEGWGG